MVVRFYKPCLRRLRSKVVEAAEVGAVAVAGEVVKAEVVRRLAVAELLEVDVVVRHPRRCRLPPPPLVSVPRVSGVRILHEPDEKLRAAIDHDRHSEQAHIPQSNDPGGGCAVPDEVVAERILLEDILEERGNRAVPATPPARAVCTLVNMYQQRLTRFPEQLPCELPSLRFLSSVPRPPVSLTSTGGTEPRQESHNAWVAELPRLQMLTLHEKRPRCRWSWPTPPR